MLLWSKRWSFQKVKTWLLSKSQQETSARAARLVSEPSLREASACLSSHEAIHLFTTARRRLFHIDPRAILVFFNFFGPTSQSGPLRMNSLVAQYSRPAYQNEGYSEQEQDEMSQTTPPLSLRFAMPPLANVSPVLFVPMFTVLFFSSESMLTLSALFIPSRCHG